VGRPVAGEWVGHPGDPVGPALKRSMTVLPLTPAVRRKGTRDRLPWTKRHGTGLHPEKVTDVAGVDVWPSKDCRFGDGAAVGGKRGVIVIVKLCTPGGDGEAWG